VLKHVWFKTMKLDLEAIREQTARSPRSTRDAEIVRFSSDGMTIAQTEIAQNTTEAEFRPYVDDGTGWDDAF